MLLGIAIFYGRPAYRGTTRVLQPDGSSVTIRLVGDEYLHYNTTDDGYSLVRRDDGAYVYAKKSNEGQLEPTTLLAHDVDERTAEERSYVERTGRLTPQPTERMAQMHRLNRAARARQLSQRRESRYDYSKFRGLVILVEYSDCPFRYDDYADIMDEMINADNYTGDSRTNISGQGIRCTGSIRDYYRDNSNGIFIPTFDVVGPVKISRSQYYVEATDNATQLMIDACTAADSQVNFRDYDVDGDGKVDMIYFIFSGLGSYIQGNDSRLLWPHQYDISYERNVRKDGVYLGRYACSTELFGNDSWSVLEGIGTMCHEFSHVLGLPDFYDTGNRYSGQCVTPDGWSLMASGSDYNYGRTPCGFSLFERYALGFASPEVISEAGSYSIDALHASNTGYRLNTQEKKEAFYIENRQNVKWDSELPGHGMLIFRVDSTNTAAWTNYNTVNDNPDHPYYELLRAGGTKSGATASDPFPGTRNVTLINNETTPSLKTWTGKPSDFGLRNIKESGGVITFEAYDVNVLSSIAFSSDTYRLGVGIKMQLTTVQDPESATCVLSFASDNEQVATVSQEGVVTAQSVGEAHITVTANEQLTATCTVIVTEVGEFPDIATFRSMEDGTSGTLRLTDAQVLYATSADIYLRDATGCIVLRGSGLEVKQNDVLNGTVFGSLSFANRMPQLIGVSTPSGSADVSVQSGSPAQPVELFSEDLSAAHYANLVLVRGARLERNGGVFVVAGDHRMRILNYLQVKSPVIIIPPSITGKYFDITAIYGTDVLNGEVIDELYLLKSPTTGQDPDGIGTPEAQQTPSEALYNLQGQRVSSGYKGIVVRDGRKVLQK